MKFHNFEDRNKDENKIDPPVDRRTFLYLMTAFLGSVMVIRQGLSESLGEFSESKMDKGNFVPERAKRIRVSPELQEMEEEHIKSIDKIIFYDENEKMDLKPEEMTEDLKNHYIKIYKERPHLRESLEKAFYEMGAWIKEIENIFEKEGVPKEFIFLAIPESHWILKDCSSRGALGPYQFMPATAREYKLKTGLYDDEDPNIDERIDPLRSARACARFLKYLYNLSGDWNLALSAYNGGFFNYYRKEMKDEGKKISYDGFIEWMELKANSEREEVMNMEEFEYTIRKDDKLSEIADFFAVNVEDLCKKNNIDIRKSDKIIEGKKIKIPMDGQDAKKRFFRHSMSDISQNLAYPAKFYAIKELIEQQFVGKQRALLKIKEIYITPKETVDHKVRRFDTLGRISRHYEIPMGMIQRLNGMGSSTKVQLDTILKIPAKPMSLRDIAELYKIDLKELKFSNPAVKDADEYLPLGYKIRICEVKD